MLTHEIKLQMAFMLVTIIRSKATFAKDLSVEILNIQVTERKKLKQLSINSPNPLVQTIKLGNTAGG